MSSPTLEVTRVSVLTEDLLQHPHLLAHARVRACAFEEGRHHFGSLRSPAGRRGSAPSTPGVRRSLSSLLEPLHRLAPTPGIARPPHFFETGHLLPLYLRIDL